ncbi:hypothetical protein GOODEAATRI_025880 [Goodea atripinnis]|uniref:Uncharacterized protein n=1 Tax=Goodea atripinnis TaxID=208336 RepID=A0ABV0PRR0_9TELE
MWAGHRECIGIKQLDQMKLITGYGKSEPKTWLELNKDTIKPKKHIIAVTEHKLKCARNRIQESLENNDQEENPKHNLKNIIRSREKNQNKNSNTLKSCQEMLNSIRICANISIINRRLIRKE